MVNGSMTKLRDKEPSSIPTKRCTKVNGWKISNMVMDVKPGVNRMARKQLIQDSSSRGKRTVRDDSSGKMARIMRAIL
jgi:hypothetical protein